MNPTRGEWMERGENCGRGRGKVGKMWGEVEGKVRGKLRGGKVSVS